MPKRNWNDINDSDSSLSSASDEETDLPKIAKHLSAPPALTSNKLKTACDEMSLRKMEKHTGSEVWLYIPNSFYQRCEEVHTLLSKSPDLKKVNRVKDIGWNVLTSKEVGRRLIQQGFAEDELFVKFIYSNRNEDRNSDERGNKNQKKVTYVEKVITPVKPEREEQNQHPAKVQQKKPQSTDLVQEKKTERQDKKKVKWVQKSKSIKEEDSKTPLTSYEELKSPPKYIAHIQSEKLTRDSPKKWDEARSPKKLSEPTEVKSPKRFKEKQTPKVEEEKVVEKAQQVKQQQRLQPAKQPQPIVVAQQLAKQQKEVVVVERVQQNKEVVEQVQSSEESVQKQKKKKKKKNKKSKQPKSDKADLNPYSYFMK